MGEEAICAETQRRLHSAFRDFCSLAPWTRIHESYPFAVEHPSEYFTAFCCVMGAKEIEYGLAVFPGHKGFSDYRDMDMDVPEDEDEPPKWPLVLRSSDALTAFLCIGERLEKWERDEVRALGLAYGSHGSWPMFRKMRPEEPPRRLREQEASFLAVVLEQASNVLGRVIAGDLNLLSPCGSELSSIPCDLEIETLDKAPSTFGSDPFEIMFPILVRVYRGGRWYDRLESSDW